jgi:hypothetical protein
MSATSAFFFGPVKIGNGLYADGALGIIIQSKKSMTSLK